MIRTEFTKSLSLTNTSAPKLDAAAATANVPFDAALSARIQEKHGSDVRRSFGPDFFESQVLSRYLDAQSAISSRGRWAADAASVEGLIPHFPTEFLASVQFFTVPNLAVPQFPWGSLMTGCSELEAAILSRDGRNLLPHGMVYKGSYTIGEDKKSDLAVHAYQLTQVAMLGMIGPDAYAVALAADLVLLRAGQKPRLSRICDDIAKRVLTSTAPVDALTAVRHELSKIWPATM